MKNALRFTAIFAVFALIGAGCSTGDLGVIDRDVEDRVNPETGYFDEVTRVGGHRTLVNPADIISWGQGVDGLPALQNPDFIAADDVDEQEDENTYYGDLPGVMVQSGDEAKFYPYQILAWHEIVHDTIDGTDIVVKYAPLVGHAGVYERALENGQAAEFGVSGYVWNNESLMYSKTSGAKANLWSGSLGGVAIYGPDAGQKLTRFPHEIVTLDTFRTLNPDGQVLSMETGYERVYTISPYANYMTSGTVHFPRVNEIVSALRSKTPVHGLVVDGVAKAFEEAEFERRGVAVINQTLGEEGRIVVWLGQNGVLYAHERNLDQAFIEQAGTTLTDSARVVWSLNADGDLQNADGETLARIPMNRMYWFAWSTQHQSSELFGYIPRRGEVDGEVVLDDGQGVNEENNNVEITVDPEFGSTIVPDTTEDE